MEKTLTQHVANWPTRIRSLTISFPEFFLQRVLLVSLVILASLAHAQRPAIQSGAVLDIPKSESIVKFTLVEDSVPAIVSRFGEALILRTFRSPQQEHPLFIRTDANNPLREVRVFGDKLFVIEQEDELKPLDLNLVVYNMFRDKVEPLFNYPFRLNQYRPNLKQSPIFINASNTGKYALVCQQEQFMKQSKAVFNVMLTDMNTANISRLPVPFDGDDIELLGASVDDQGVVYMAALAGVKLNSPFRKKYLIYTYNSTDSVLTEFDLSSGSLFMHDIVFSNSAMGFQVSGLYNSDPLDEAKTTGYVYIQLTSDGKEIEKRIVTTFDPSLVSVFEGPENATIGNIRSIYLNKPLMIGGEPHLVIEKRYKDQLCTADPRTGMLNCTDQFHFDGVSILNIMEQSNFANIEKRQLDYDKVSIYTSHGQASLDDGSAIVLYNDHSKSEGLSNVKLMNNPQRSVIRYVVLRPDGTVFTNTISETIQEDYHFIPHNGIQVFENKVFLLTGNNRNLRVMAMEPGKI